MKIGFIGLGLMGEPMSLNLVKKSGYPVYVLDFDADKTVKIVASGAKAATSDAEIAQKCDVIFSMVPKSEHVTALYAELQRHARPGQIYIDMSTIDPEVSIKVARDIASTGAVMLDAPVVKSRPAAFEGTLGIYVGGPVAAYKTVKPLLECLGSNVIHLGENGRGLIMKLCHNALVAQIQNGVNEMMTVAKSFGVGIEDFATCMSYGGASNFYLTSKLASLKNENYEAAFSLENMDKDLSCLLNLLQEKHLTLGGVLNVKRIYDAAIADNLGQEDFSATLKTVEKIAKSSSSGVIK